MREETGALRLHSVQLTLLALADPGSDRPGLSSCDELRARLLTADRSPDEAQFVLTCFQEPPLLAHDDTEPVRVWGRAPADAVLPEDVHCYELSQLLRPPFDRPTVPVTCILN